MTSSLPQVAQRYIGVPIPGLPERWQGVRRKVPSGASEPSSSDGSHTAAVAVTAFARSAAIAHSPPQRTSNSCDHSAGELVDGID
jgi:hypothetical protein